MVLSKRCTVANEFWRNRYLRHEVWKWKTFWPVLLEYGDRRILTNVEELCHLNTSLVTSAHKVYTHIPKLRNIFLLNSVLARSSTVSKSRNEGPRNRSSIAGRGKENFLPFVRRPNWFWGPTSVFCKAPKLVLGPIQRFVRRPNWFWGPSNVL
jgi:hypothetical protein